MKELKFVDTAKIGQLLKKRATDGGFDIKSSVDVEIPPKGRAAVSTGLHVSIPEGFVGLCKARSGTSFTYGIEVGAGVIDSDYRGEVKVNLYNNGDTTYKVNKGDRIAQLVICCIYMDTAKEVDTVAELGETERGFKGFGSSGK